MLENNAARAFLHKHRIKIGIIGTYLLILSGMLWIPQITLSTDSNAQAINIIIFPEVVPVELLRDFTKETGITVYAKHVESDSEMCACLADRNNSYDAVCIPEYLIPELNRLNEIEPINRLLIPNYENLHSIFKTDLAIKDSVPFSWALFGLGIDTKTYPSLNAPSWSMLFEKLNHKICVSDDPRSLVLMGALALNYSTETLSEKQVAAITLLLKSQKPNVEIYTDTNIALLFANEIVPLAFTSYKALALANQFNPTTKFIVPKEGGVRIAQDWIIPKNTPKLNAAHTFINFMISAKMSELNDELTEFLPTNNAVLNKYWEPVEQLANTCPLPSERIIRNTHKAPQNISPTLLSSLWITLKNT